MYDRVAAVAYAHRWAFRRNPDFMNFSGIGGDCTNFVSQCLYAGNAPMNFTPDIGWYYLSPKDRAAAWSGVQYLHNFLLGDMPVGPFAHEVGLAQLMPGDVVQLAFVPGTFTHTLLVVQTAGGPDPKKILIAAHSDDSDNRPLSTYWAVEWRYLSIGARG